MAIKQEINNFLTLKAFKELGQFLGKKLESINSKMDTEQHSLFSPFGLNVKLVLTTFDIGIQHHVL